jgi:hypothetical protein
MEYTILCTMVDKTQNLLRLVVLDGDAMIFLNEQGGGATSIVLTREQLVDLGKALIKAWEIAD